MIRAASRRARSRIAGDTNRSATITSASCSARMALKVSRSGSPGPAPTRVTRPSSGGVPASSRSTRLAALWKSSARYALATGPSKKPSQNWRRAVPLAMAAAARRRKPAAQRASPPRRAGSIASSRALICRASTGAVPSVPIATMTGSRSTIAGVMKSHSSCRSTAFTGTPAARAIATAPAASASSSSATYARRTSAKSRAASGRRSNWIAPAAAKPAISSHGPCARTRMRALVLVRSRIFWAACSPPPTTSTG